MMKKRTSFQLYRGYAAQSDSNQWIYLVPFFFFSSIVLEVDDIQKEHLRRKHAVYNSIAILFSGFIPLLCLEIFTLKLHWVIALTLISLFLHDVILKGSLKKELTTYSKRPLLSFLSLTRKTDTAEHIQRDLLQKKRWLVYSLIPLTLVASIPFFGYSFSFSDRSNMYFAMLLTLGVMYIIREVLAINRMNAEG